jgi:hypothetical protein
MKWNKPTILEEIVIRAGDDANQETAMAAAFDQVKVKAQLEGKSIKKITDVAGCILNILVAK